MSYEDPFAEPAPAQVQESTPSVEVAPTPTGEVVVTLKGGRDFDAPWIVIHAPTAEAALDQFTTNGATLVQLMDRAKKASAHFSGASALRATDGAGQKAVPQAAPQRAAPQASQEAPGGEERFCNHGKMVFKSGVAAKTGKPYKLFSCTAPRESQCPAEFLK